MTDLLDTPEPQARFHTEHFMSDRVKYVIYGLFIVGLIFKNRHWPAGSLMMVACGGFSAFFVMAQFAEALKFHAIRKGLFGISIGLAFIYLVFRFQYWPGGIFVLVFSGVSGLAAILYKREQEVNLLKLFPVGLAFFLSSVSTSTVYYYTNMSKTLNPFDHEYACMAWERYAHFLEAEGKQEEANKARMTWIECMQKSEF